MVAGEPNRALTPGHAFATAATAQICVSGYSASVRDVTEDTRKAVFASYAVAYPPPSGAYELDHLIPLELGGDNTAANLWPETYHGAGSADVKDHLENHLHDLVCAGQLDLPTAQQAISGDWMSAAAKYNPVSVNSAAPAAPPAPPAPPAAPASQTPAPAPEPAPTRQAEPPVAPGGGATALCADGSLSYAEHHQGACSKHGGVSVFYK